MAGTQSPLSQRAAARSSVFPGCRRPQGWMAVIEGTPGKADQALPQPGDQARWVPRGRWPGISALAEGAATVQVEGAVVKT